jgi:vesicular inhibitory amino acid transporter
MGIRSDWAIILSRTAVSFAALLFAISFPIFYKVMGFIGSTMSFLIAVITPTLCYLKLRWSEPNSIQKCMVIFVLVLGLILMTVGTLGVLYS